MKIYSFSFPHKTASMFAYKVGLELSATLGCKMFTQNGKAPNISEFPGWHGDCCVVGPLRNYAVEEFVRQNQNVNAVLDIAQVRDPLDICVSQFFSHGWIHSDTSWTPDQVAQRKMIQAGEISLAEYAKMELDGEALFGGGSILDKWTKLEVGGGNIKRTVVRYEDMMLDFGKWAGELVRGFELDASFVDALEKLRPDYREPDKEQRNYFDDEIKDYLATEFKASHIRSAWPGEHKRFLSPEQIAKLRNHIRERQPRVMEFYA